MIDTHTHLNFIAFQDDWQNVVERAIENGVRKMIVVGTDIESSRRAVELSSQHKALFAAVGIHPHHARGIINQDFKVEESIQEINKLCNNPKVVAIGEVGLDYHVYGKTKYDIKNTEKEWKVVVNIQKQLFSEQIKIALELNKPVILHSREAKDDVLNLLLSISGEIGKTPKGVFHCFEGSKKYLKRILDAGIFISFTGNITYSEDRLSASSLVPLDKLLLETDSPLIAPAPHRNQRNEPAYVKIIAELHAKIRKVHLNKVINQTSENASQLFEI